MSLELRVHVFMMGFDNFDLLLGVGDRSFLFTCSAAVVIFAITRINQSKSTPSDINPLVFVFLHY